MIRRSRRWRAICSSSPRRESMRFRAFSRTCSAVGACHFGSFYRAMEAAQHIVKLGPIAVELIDRTMLGLAREIAMFEPTIKAVVRGDPEAILFVEFAEEDPL